MNNVDVILTFLTVVVLGLTLYQQRKHNRVQVRPFLASTIVTSSSDPNFLKIEFSIYNKGFGPAFIKSFRVFHRNEFISENNWDLFNEPFLKIFKPRTVRFGTGIVGPSTAIAVNEHRVLACLEGKEAICTFSELQRLLREFSFEIDYESAYGEKRTLSCIAH